MEGLDQCTVLHHSQSITLFLLTSSHSVCCPPTPDSTNPALIKVIDILHIDKFNGNLPSLCYLIHVQCFTLVFLPLDFTWCQDTRLLICSSFTDCYCILFFTELISFPQHVGGSQGFRPILPGFLSVVTSHLTSLLL